MPVILADEHFVGLGVLSSDEYTGGNGGADEWFINQVRSIPSLHFQHCRNVILINVLE